MKVKAKRGDRWDRKLREEVKRVELGLGRNRVRVKERVSITYLTLTQNLKLHPNS